MAAATSALPVPVFVGERYDLWAVKMEVILMARELWDFVSQGLPPPPEAETGEQARQWKNKKLRDLTALQLIHSAVSEEIFTKISHVRMSKQAWDILKEEFEGNDKVKQVKAQNLRREFEHVSMKPNESVKDYANRVVHLASQLRLQGDELTELEVIKKILLRLSTKYESIVTVIEETKDLKTLKVSELLGSLQAHEQRLITMEEPSSEGAFVVKQQNSNLPRKQKGKKWCAYCKKDNHFESSCFLKNRRLKGEGSSSSGWRSKKQCYNCRRMGHFARDCKVKPGSLRVADQVQNTERGNAEAMDAEVMFMAMHEDEVEEDEPWLIDSGCSNHMCKDLRYFSSLDRSIKTPIKIGDGSILKAKGKGDVLIYSDRGPKLVKQVYYVPELSKNLLSVHHVTPRPGPIRPERSLDSLDRIITHRILP